MSAAAAEARRLKEQTTVERQRIKSTRSKIYSWNDKYCEKIDQRKEEERVLKSLLYEIRKRMGGEAEDPEGEELHSLEKRLAAAQNWVVPPPSVQDPMFKLTAKPTSPIGWTAGDGEPDAAHPLNVDVFVQRESVLLCLKSERCDILQLLLSVRVCNASRSDGCEGGERIVK